MPLPSFVTVRPINSWIFSRLQCRSSRGYCEYFILWVIMSAYNSGLSVNHKTTRFSSPNTFWLIGVNLNILFRISLLVCFIFIAITLELIASGHLDIVAMESLFRFMVHLNAQSPRCPRTSHLCSPIAIGRHYQFRDRWVLFSYRYEIRNIINANSVFH